MKRTNTQLLSDVLVDFMNDNPLLAEKIAETRLLNAWPKILGHLTEKYTTELYVRKKVLYVRLTSAVLKNELSLCREQLIKRLNEAAGMIVINDILLL